jgi:hypothetical protein
MRESLKRLRRARVKAALENARLVRGSIEQSGRAFTV